MAPVAVAVYRLDAVEQFEVSGDGLLYLAHPYELVGRVRARRVARSRLERRPWHECLVAQRGRPEGLQTHLQAPLHQRVALRDVRRPEMEGAGAHIRLYVTANQARRPPGWCSTR